MAQPTKINDEEIGRRLEVNKKELGGATMPELGFMLSLWNEEGTSISITIGATSPWVKNAVALSYKGGVPVGADVWRAVLRTVADVMDPDSALVADKEARSRNPQAPLWEVAWARYERGGEIVERSAP